MLCVLQHEWVAKVFDSFGADELVLSEEVHIMLFCFSWQDAGVAYTCFCLLFFVVFVFFALLGVCSFRSLLFACLLKGEECCV